MLVDELRRVLPAERIVTAPEILTTYRHDEAPWAAAGTPLAVVRPRETAEVAALVRFCRDHRVPLVPRGAGTGVSGGANAVESGIVLSFEDMDRILDIDTGERIAVVQPGVVNDDLSRACAEVGLWYPPDPASSAWSTIGGNVATNAGGICCAKYGVTRDYVLGMEIVDGHGEVGRLGRRTVKGVAGYDLCGLMVGSEGTLGAITEITLRLRPPQGAERTVAGYFDSLPAAGDAVSAVIDAGIQPSALELMDRHCLDAIDAWKKMGLATEAEAVLLGRTDTPGAEGELELQRMRDCFTNAGATWAEVSTDEQESEALFEARRLVYYALDRLGSVLSEDVCVPRRAVPEMLARISKTAAEHDILIASVAHAADGNLHPCIVTPHGDEAARTRAQRAFETIMDDALALGGTVTGEHGIGLLKKAGMARELDAIALAMQVAVKRALDPLDIFNPGKVVDARPDVP